MPVESWAIPGGVLGALMSALLTVVLFVARGKLIPASTVDRLEARYQAELLAKDRQIAQLQQIADRERTNADQTRAQLDKMMVAADTTERLMVAMREKVITP